MKINIFGPREGSWKIITNASRKSKASKKISKSFFYCFKTVAKYSGHDFYPGSKLLNILKMKQVWVDHEIQSGLFVKQAHFPNIFYRKSCEYILEIDLDYRPTHKWTRKWSEFISTKNGIFWLKSHGFDVVRDFAYKNLDYWNLVADWLMIFGRHQSVINP